MVFFATAFQSSKYGVSSGKITGKERDEKKEKKLLNMFQFKNTGKLSLKFDRYIGKISRCMVGNVA